MILLYGPRNKLYTITFLEKMLMDLLNLRISFGELVNGFNVQMLNYQRLLDEILSLQRLIDCALALY